MEMTNWVVKDGVIHILPIGFRFKPTYQELLVHYLNKKVLSLPLPVSCIPDLDVFHLNPWDLPGKAKERKYFFVQKKMNLTNKRKGKLSTDSGYWRGTNREKQIMAPGSDVVMGLKKSRVFYKREEGRVFKTQWVMQVFCLVGFVDAPNTNERIMEQFGDWVVCRVLKRKRRARRSQSLAVAFAEIETTSCASGITEVSSNELVDQEAISRLY